jgi:signal transduction histidine kinase
MPRWSGPEPVRRLTWPAVGALLGGLSIAEWLIEGLENSLALAAPGLLVAALLALCPRWPAATAVLGASSVLVNLLGGAPGPGGAQFVGMGLLVGHAVAVLPRRRATNAAAAAVVAATVLGSILAPNPWESIFYVLVLGSAAAVGALVAQSRRRAAELQVLAARLAAQQEAVAASAAVAERARIAREVHDSVAHSVSVMVLQMGGLRRLLPDEPRAQEVLLGLERLGREAVDEMRRVVGILRDGAGGGAGAAPQPSLSRIDAVLDELRAGGLPVRLDVTGEPRPLPQLVDVSAVRVVQEALSNVLRHAGGAATTVELRYAPDRVTVVVTDDGRRRLPAPDPEARTSVGGHGQLHMRERVAVAGGTLEVGPVRGGGYRVRASFPVPATVPPQAATAVRA